MLNIQKWGGLASFVQAAIFLIAPVIYLVALPAATGLPPEAFSDPHQLRPVLANPVFDFGDILFGPLWAIATIVAAFGLRDRMKEGAPTRMLMAVLFAGMSGALFIGGSTVQTIGRHSMARMIELDADMFEAIFRTISIVVPGLTSGGRLALGCFLLVTAWAGLGTRQIPRLLSILYIIGGIPLLMAFRFPFLGEPVLLVGAIWNIWQGIVLWRGQTPANR
jgi:hypothetical protein